MLVNSQKCKLINFSHQSLSKMSQEMRCWQGVEPADLVAICLPYQGSRGANCHLVRPAARPLFASGAKVYLVDCCHMFASQGAKCQTIIPLLETQVYLVCPTLFALPETQMPIAKPSAGNLLGVKYCLVECPTRGLEAYCQMINPSASWVFSNICKYLPFNLFPILLNFSVNGSECIV